MGSRESDVTRVPSLLSTEFRDFEGQMVRLLDYANVVAPSLKAQPRLLPEFSDSMVILAVTRLDSFFRSLVSLGTRAREQQIRRHFQKHGNKDARTCDLPSLVKLVRGRVSFEDGGKRLDNLFRLVFEYSVWPSDEIRDLVMDLVRLRHFIIHSSGQDWSQAGVSQAAYASQFKRANVIDVRRYGNLATYSVDHYKTLLFLRDAVQAIVEQAKYLETHLCRPRDGQQIQNGPKPV